MHNVGTPELQLIFKTRRFQRRETDLVSWTAIATWRQAPLKTSCEFKACEVVCLPARPPPMRPSYFTLQGREKGVDQSGRRCPRFPAARRSNLQRVLQLVSRTPGWSRDRLHRGGFCGGARETIHFIESKASIQSYLLRHHTLYGRAEPPTGVCVTRGLAVIKGLTL